MQEPPRGVSEPAVLACVREHWLPEADAVTHLPVGFGAHHWRADADGAPRLFVTLDMLGGQHSAGSIEAAYAAAAQLAADGLEFVHASWPSRAGTYTVPLGTDGRLSVVAWLDGEPGSPHPWDAEHAAQVADLLARLHAASPPVEIQSWSPVVAPDLPDRLSERLAQPWDGGPFGARARDAVAEHLPQIRVWSARYDALTWAALSRRWVPTHGEPHGQNQLHTADGLYLVDWESLLLAPPERDTRTLAETGHQELADVDARMVEMFDLEWRLSEVAEYACWFSAPHSGDADDRVAFAGLLDELGRPDQFVER